MVKPDVPAIKPEMDPAVPLGALVTYTPEPAVDVKFATELGAVSPNANGLPVSGVSVPVLGSME